LFAEPRIPPYRHIRIPQLRQFGLREGRLLGSVVFFYACG